MAAARTAILRLPHRPPVDGLARCDAVAVQALVMAANLHNPVLGFGRRCKKDRFLPPTKEPKSHHGISFYFLESVTVVWRRRGGVQTKPILQHLS